MDYALKSRRINTVSEILDTVTQQQVDLDFTLPDYCADIEKILKCSLDVKIYTRSLSGGMLRIDGASVVRIIYCDSNKSAMRCCEQTLPFTANFPISGEVGDYIITASAKPEYLNCRALTPRRLTVHGAFSLYAGVSCRSFVDLYEGESYDGLQLRSENITACELCDFSQDQFSFSETVAMNSKSSVESIVRSELSVAVKDTKHQGEKVLLNGELTLRMLYICDAASGETDQFVCVMPFTQMLDKADDSCEVSDVTVSVMSYDIMLKSEPVSGEVAISLDAKLCATLMGYKSLEATYASDAYSTDCDTTPSYETLSLCTNVLPVSATSMLKSAVSLGDVKIQKIVDIFTESTTVTGEIGDSCVNFGGKVNICILAYTDDGELVSIDRQVDVNSSELISGTFTHIGKVSSMVTSISYRLGDSNDLELRLELRLGAILSDIVTLRQVTYLSGCEANTCENVCPLTLYYAHKGENVWDIAKVFRADVDTVINENSLTETTLSEPSMLLVLRA